MEAKVLFVIKQRSCYGQKTSCYGLVCSCDFIAKALNQAGIEAKVVQVTDANDIDREVNHYRPTHCFIEALWVTPAKLVELAPLHPNINWIVRIHSMAPFLACEGISFDWLNHYHKLKESGLKLKVSCNNRKLQSDLNLLYGDIGYSPNIYLPDNSKDTEHEIRVSGIINIGCFGALRPLKNHCQQALWAIKFANKVGKTLHFHVNVSDCETENTSPVLKNLKAIFYHSKHILVEHPWMPHSEFLRLVKRMDLGMQISFTETFNIVAADFVYCEVPVVVSEEIDFVDEDFRVFPSDPTWVLAAMETAYFDKSTGHSKQLLDEHNKSALKTWKFLVQ